MKLQKDDVVDFLILSPVPRLLILKLTCIFFDFLFARDLLFYDLNLILMVVFSFHVTLLLLFKYKKYNDYPILLKTKYTGSKPNSNSMKVEKLLLLHLASNRTISRVLAIFICPINTPKINFNTTAWRQNQNSFRIILIIVYSLILLMIPIKSKNIHTSTITNSDQSQFYCCIILLYIITINDFFSMAGNILFLFQDIPLTFQPAHVSDILYFEAKAKIIRQNDLKQANQLQEMLKGIQDVEATQKSKISYESKVIIGPRRINDFYQYNQDWQRNIIKRNEDAKKERIRRQAKEEESLKQHKYKEHSLSISDHCGPVSGWDHHFQNYIKIRNSGCEEDKELFKPKVNKNSQKIIKKKYEGREKQKVEQRLFKKSQQKKLSSFSTIKHDNQTNISMKANPEIFNKLYNDATKQARKKEQIREKHQFTFEPKINKNTAYDSIVEERRRPLHLATQPTHIVPMQEQKELERQYSQELFNNFLQRNEILLSKRKNTQMQIRKQTDQQIMKECTFSPLLNQRSVTLIQNARNSSLSVSNIDVSHDSLEMSSKSYKNKVQLLVPPIATIPEINRQNYDTEVLKTQQSTRRRELRPIINTCNKKQGKPVQKKYSVIGRKQESRSKQHKREYTETYENKCEKDFQETNQMKDELVVINSSLLSKQNIDFSMNVKGQCEVLCDQIAEKSSDNKSYQESIDDSESKANIQCEFMDQFEMIERQLEEMIKSAD